jgi:hypothetical protein
MFETFDEMVTEEAGFNIDQDNPLFDLMNEAKNNILRADNKIKDIYKENSVDFYVEISGYMNEFLKKELAKKLKDSLTGKLTEAQIESIYNKAVTAILKPEDLAEIAKMNPDIEVKYIKQFADEYQKFNVNIDKITDGLSGKLKDVSWFSRMFESYASSNDPIVGGLATYIDDQRIEAQQTAIQKSYKFRNELEKMLPKIGFNKYNTRQLVDMLMFKDKVLTLDPKTKEPITKEVYTFLNEFKDYRYDLAKLEYDLEAAEASEDQEKIKEAANALRQFNRDYMQDQYVPEFYQKDDIFDKYPPHIGKAAWVARKIALDAYNNEQNEITDELDNRELYWINKYGGIDSESNYNLKDPVTKEFSDYLKVEIKKSMSGEKNPNYGNNWSEEQKDVASKKRKGVTLENRIGKYKADLTKQKMSESQIGRKHPEEVKEKIRQANVGDKNPAYGKGDRQVGDKNPMFGKHHTKETKKLLSLSSKNKIVSDETKLKMSESAKNRYKTEKKHTEEVKEKIRKANVGDKNPMWGKGDRQIGDKNPMWGKPSIKRKAIQQYTKDGIFVKEYEFLSQVTDDGFHIGNVGAAANGKLKSSGGFIWKFKE